MASLDLVYPTAANLVHLQSSPRFATINARLYTHISTRIGPYCHVTSRTRLVTCSTRLFGCGQRIPHFGQALLNLPRRLSFKVTFCTTRGVEEMEQDHSREKAIGVSEKDGDTEFGKVKSDTYSANMTNAMGAVLTYRHELGINYNFVRPDLIVGSCLQTPSDVDRLRNIGVKTIFCLQQDPDLDYFGVDICAIQERAKVVEGIEHIRAPIRDFDPFDLRVRLPVVIAKLDEAVQRNKGITYIHCTAGLGRAPAVALTYMYWLLGYKLHEANKVLQNVRPCFPKLESIRNATCDILTGQTKETVVLQWKHGNCEIVEISGLDVGWGQRLPLTYFPEEQCWMLSRQLPVGRYEYKYIIDGTWTHNPDEGVTETNNGGHINNFIEVIGDSADDETRALRQRLMRDDVSLSDLECQTIHQRLKDLV